MRLLELLTQIRSIPIKQVISLTEQKATFRSAISLVIQKTADREENNHLGFDSEHALVQAIMSCGCVLNPKKVSSYLIRALDAEDSNGDSAKGE